MAFYVEGLLVSDNEVTRISEADTLEEAVEIAKRVIDDFLSREFKAGTLPEDLYIKYKDGGIVPFIFRDDGATMNVRTFNHLKYAMAQCEKLCTDDPDMTVYSRPKSNT